MLNDQQLSQIDDIKHIDRRLTRRKHINTIRKQLGQMQWLIGKKNSVINAKKVITVQSNSETYLDIRDTAEGHIK